MKKCIEKIDSKKEYEVPQMEVLDFKVQGVLCDSTPSGGILCEDGTSGCE